LLRQPGPLSSKPREGSGSTNRQTGKVDGERLF